MPWNVPVTDYLTTQKVLNTIFNDMGENDVYLKERADVVDSNINQGVKTTDSPTFNQITTTGVANVNSLSSTNTIGCPNINTGQGVTEVFPMNQAVRTTDNVTFGSVKTDNVSLKHKRFSGTSTGSTFTIPHGLTYSKIISISGNIEVGVTPKKLDMSTSGIQLTWDTTNIIVENLLGIDPYVIVVTYEI